jgi:hypothetical protein
MHLWLLAEFVLPEASVVILRGGGSYPPVNVFRKGEDLVIIAELRGVKKSTSTSRWRAAPSGWPERKAALHRRERLAGRFDRAVTPDCRNRSDLEVRFRRAAWESGATHGGDFLRRLIPAVPCKVHIVLADNGAHFTTPGNMSSAAPDIEAALDAGEPI